MARRRHRRHGPVVLTGPGSRRKRRLSAREETFGKAALDTPVPGRILVLLSRLHRSEQADASYDKGPTN